MVVRIPLQHQKEEEEEEEEEDKRKKRDFSHFACFILLIPPLSVPVLWVVRRSIIQTLSYCAVLYGTEQEELFIDSSKKKDFVCLCVCVWIITTVGQPDASSPSRIHPKSRKGPARKDDSFMIFSFSFSLETVGRAAQKNTSVNDAKGF